MSDKKEFTLITEIEEENKDLFRLEIKEGINNEVINTDDWILVAKISYFDPFPLAPAL